MSREEPSLMTDEELDLLNKIGCNCMDHIQLHTFGLIDPCSALVFIAGQMFVTAMKNGLDISDELAQSLDDEFNEFTKQQIAKVNRIIGS